MNSIRVIVAASMVIIMMQSCSGPAKEQAENKSTTKEDTGETGGIAGENSFKDDSSQYRNAGTPSANEQAQNNSPVQQGRMEFVRYNDDGDYFLLIAKDKNDTHDFINNVVEDRNLNRGDFINVKWRDGIITIAGDGDTPQAADLLVSVSKIRDGKVSNFRKSYKQQLKYIPAKDREYSASYLDQVKQDLEYYLVNTSNEHLLKAISKREDISFSLEEEKRNGRMYMVATISVNEPATPVQWVYIDQENGKIWEWDEEKNILVNEM